MPSINAAPDGGGYAAAIGSIPAAGQAIAAVPTLMTRFSHLLGEQMYQMGIKVASVHHNINPDDPAFVDVATRAREWIAIAMESAPCQELVERMELTEVSITRLLSFIESLVKPLLLDLADAYHDGTLPVEIAEYFVVYNPLRMVKDAISETNAYETLDSYTSLHREIHELENELEEKRARLMILDLEQQTPALVAHGQQRIDLETIRDLTNDCLARQSLNSCQQSG